MRRHIMLAHLLLLSLVLTLAACGRRPTDAQSAAAPTAPPTSAPAATASGSFATSAPAPTAAATSAPAPTAAASPTPATAPVAAETPTPDPAVDSQPPQWSNRLSDVFGATEIAPTSMTLAWPVATDESGAVTYEIYVGPSDPGLPGITINNTHLSLAGTSSIESYTVGGLTPNTIYTFAVIAVDAAGNRSTRRGPLILSTKDNQAPAAPANLRYVPDRSTSDSLYLMWDLSADDSWIIRYELFVDGNFYQNLSFYENPDRSGDATVEGLSVLQTYDIYIVAVDRDENRSAPSNTIRVQIPDTIAPSDLENLHVTARDGQKITVAWDPSTDNVGVTEYAIYHSDRVVATTSETSYTFTGIALDDFYIIWVVARDQAGNESYSRERISITDAPVS